MKLKKMICSFAIISIIACVGPVQAFAASSSEIEAQIASYMADLEASQEKSEELETQISEKQDEVGELYAEVAALNIEKESYYEDMKTRIAYFYEESQNYNLLGVLLSSRNFAELISRIEFQQSIYDYDTDRLEEYQALVDNVNEKQEKLDAEIEDLGDMVEEQVVLQATLEATIYDKNTELEEVKAEEAAAAAAAAAKKAAEEEAARRAALDAVDYAMTYTSSSSSDTSSESSSSSDTESTSSSSSSDTSSTSSSSDESSYTSSETSSASEESAAESTGSSSSSSSSYSTPSGDGVLTRSKGVNYYNGHKETWYSQRTMPGNGLNIPGRHVNELGLVCDGDGYICVASSDYPKGTIVETSLGTGKVYDCGCASGTIDIYTDW